MNQNAVWVQFDQYFFVLGMEWRLLEPTEKLVRSTLTTLRREGMKWYASNGLQNFVGMCNTIAGGHKDLHSAALHLASQWSNGNLELYVFGMPGQQVALVALNDRRPLPGYDFIGSLTDAQALIDEFESIHQGEEVRRVGDLGLLVGEEPLSAKTVFDQAAADSKLKKVPSIKTLVLFVSTTLLGMSAIGGAYYWQLQNRSQLLAGLPSSLAPDPNPAYNQQASQRVKELSAENQYLYMAWLHMAMQLPLQHQGWELVQVECKLKDCTANWNHQFGSVTDFYNNPPPNTSKTEQLVIDKNVLSQVLQTTHSAPPFNDKPIYDKPSDLPQSKEGFRVITSWLQDLGLMGALNAKVEKAQAWNIAEADAVLIKQPLYKGNWSVELPLGLAPDLVVPPFASVTFMKTNLGPTYQLSGDFYVYADSP
jgi:hypothetical protein